MDADEYRKKQEMSDAEVNFFHNRILDSVRKYESVYYELDSSGVGITVKRSKAKFIIISIKRFYDLCSRHFIFCFRTFPERNVSLFGYRLISSPQLNDEEIIIA